MFFFLPITILLWYIYKDRDGVFLLYIQLLSVFQMQEEIDSGQFITQIWGFNPKKTLNVLPLIGDLHATAGDRIRKAFWIMVCRATTQVAVNDKDAFNLFLTFVNCFFIISSFYSQVVMIVVSIFNEHFTLLSS